MADKADVVLERGTVKILSGERGNVRILSSGSSPVLDVEGGNHWNLAESNGDFRIGTDQNMMKMGVAKGGGGAGNGRIWATSDLKLGSRGESVVSVDDQGVHPQNGDYSLGAADNRWFVANLGILDVAEGVSSNLEPFYFSTPDDDKLNLGSDGARWGTLWVDNVETESVTASGNLSVEGEVYADGNLTLTGEGGSFTGRAIVEELAVNKGAFTIKPLGSGQNLGGSDARWETLYVNNTNTASDRRLKTDIENLDGGLDAVLDLRPVSYTRRENGSGTKFGLVAQEVADVLPELVSSPDDDGYLGLDYTKLVPVLIDAIQSQQAETEALEERVDEQQEQIEDQQARIDDLEARLVALEEAA